MSLQPWLSYPWDKCEYFYSSVTTYRMLCRRQSANASLWAIYSSLPIICVIRWCPNHCVVIWTNNTRCSPPQYWLYTVNWHWLIYFGFIWCLYKTSIQTCPSWDALSRSNWNFNISIKNQEGVRFGCSSSASLTFAQIIRGGICQIQIFFNLYVRFTCLILPTFR